MLTKLEEAMNEYALEFTKEYVKEALELNAYLHIIYHYEPEADPLDVEFFWDEEGFGKLAKMNLRDEYLEVYKEDPERHAPNMPAVIASLRSLADEIEQIYKSAIGEK